MAYEKCNTCDEYGFTDRHICPQIWEARVFETKYENDWAEIYGSDAEEAAKKFARQYDQQGEYDILRRGSEEIEVRKCGTDEIILVDVSAESVPTYYASVR